MVVPSGVLSLFVIGLALAIALRLMAGDAPAESATLMVLRIASVACMVIGGLGFLVGIGLVLGFTLWFAALVITAMVFARRRLLRRRMLLSLMALAAEKHMPLTELLHALTLEHWGLWRYRLRELTDHLEHGTTLAVALASTPGLLSREAHLAAQVGEQSGQLGTALRDMVAAMQRLHPLAHATIARLTYLLFAVVFATATASFILYNIAPQLMKIFSDYGLPLPPVTRVVWGVVGNNPIVFWGVQALLLTLIGLVGWSVLVYVGWAPPRFGPLERLLVRLDRSVVMRSLSLLLARDADLPRALEVLDEWYPKAWIRRRIIRAEYAIAAGKDWIESLRNAGLLSSTDVGVLAAATRVGNVPWAMRELAEVNERRLIYRLEALLGVLFPIVVLLFGAFVALFVVAGFIPCVALIQHLT